MESSSLLPILQDRQCGSCSLCCKLLPIAKSDVFDFEKAAGEWCSHCAPGLGGCTIYDTRPQGCRNYKCEWLKGNLPEALKPDTINAIFEQKQVENIPYYLIVWDSTQPLHPELERFLLTLNGKQRLLIYDCPKEFGPDQPYIAGLGETEEKRHQDALKLRAAFKRQGEQENIR